MFDLNTMPDKGSRSLKRKPDEIDPIEDPDYAFVRDKKKSREDDVKTRNDGKKPNYVKTKEILSWLDPIPTIIWTLQE